MVLLNLGCGDTYHKNWINIDSGANSENIIKHDLLLGIPLEKEAVDVVYHSHILEHFSKEDGYKFMKECFRVLKKNGIIRIAVPDLEMIAKEYLRNLNLALEGDELGKANYEWIKLELIDQMVRNKSGGEMGNYLSRPIIKNEEYVYKRIGLEGKKIRLSILKKKELAAQANQEFKKRRSRFQLIKKFGRNVFNKLFKGEITQDPHLLQKEKINRINEFRLKGEIHQWMYDRYSLGLLLHNTGFKNIRGCTPFTSEIPNWNSYGLEVEDGVIRKPDSLFIEAQKL